MDHDFKNPDFPILSKVSTKNRFKTLATNEGGSRTARF